MRAATVRVMIGWGVRRGTVGGGVRRVGHVVWIVSAFLWLAPPAAQAPVAPARDLTESVWLAFDHFFSGMMVLEWWGAGLREPAGGKTIRAPALSVTADLLAAQEHFRQFEAALAALVPQAGEAIEAHRITVAQRAARRLRGAIDDGVTRMRDGDATALAEIGAARCAALAEAVLFYDITTTDDLFPNEVFLDQRRGLERLYRWQRRYLERSRC